jgi:predicted AAA+ superfamily ATPase
MEREFNITGLCFPEDHFMADVSHKLRDTLTMIEKGKYFIINRPRQYGKTTTMHTLENMLQKTDDYLALNISFEGIGDLIFDDERMFHARAIQQTRP